MRDLNQLLFNFEYKQNFKDEDFYVSSSNYYAFKLINSWPKWEKNFLNICGEKYSGKTHLSNIFLKKFKGIKIDANSFENKNLKEIKIYTDSKYVKEGITVWINTWEKNNWKTADKKNVKNVDLWKRLKELVKSKQIEWHWIKGHSEDPMNDLADELAKKATPI